MKTFTDAAGRTWTISITIGSVMQVKAKLGIDLMHPEVGDPPLLTRIATDDLLLAEIICTLLEGQFEAQHVTEQDVYAAFDGATLAAVHDAFFAEWTDFFLSRKRPDLARGLQKQTAALAAAIKAVETRIDAFDIETAVATAMGRGAMSGPSPEQSGSTPGR